MDSIPVNWEALDALIIDFARSENIIEESSSFSNSISLSPPSSPCSVSSSSSSSSSSYHSRLVIRQIRRSLETGDIDAAIELLKSHAPFVLDDHRILFRLQKQRFIELLRRGTSKDREAAVDCLRTSLAPCALDAYPEAYEEFKHVLLAFIYDKDDQTSPVANEWSKRRRSEIAGLLLSVLRAHFHAYDPIFSMTLRYLISIHKEFCLRQGMSSPISNLTERLLLEERDPPATLHESLYGAPPFDEVDIQALAHAVELTRQGAVDSLRFAKGDLFQAFQNELCRMRLNVPILDELVHEYCVYRGIVDCGVPTASGQSKGSCSLEGDSAVSKNTDGGSVCNAYTDGYSDHNCDATSKRDTDVDLRYACEPASNNEVCSTSGQHQSYCASALQRDRSCRSGQRSKRKRWRGRHDDLSLMPDASLDGSNRMEICPATQDVLKEQEGSKKQFLSVMKNRQLEYEFMLEMKELASTGMAAEVVKEVNSVDPEFFSQNPVLLFQLKQVEFLKLVNSGDHAGALKVACAHLGPLATNNSELLKPLKETLLALLQPKEDAPGKSLPLDALATSLQVAIGRDLGIEEPQLMKIMRATLHTHNEWFKLQMCKDRFESLLRIDSLKDVTRPMIASAMQSKLNADSCTHGSSTVTSPSSVKMADDGSSPTQVSSTDVCDESAILKVMEFLAMPRADAIHLLAQYNGNAEAVIQQLFA